MFLKACVAGALALVLSTEPQALGTTTAFTHNPYIEQIVCDGGKGTGFKLADGRWMSAHHVTRLGNCKVDGITIVITDFDERTDYSIFNVPGDNRRGGLTPDCSGYHDKQWVHGTGHARGLPILTSVPVMFSRFMQSENSKSWAVLIYNRFIPGMSGGPVLNNFGQPAGIVNAYAIFFPGSFSIPLSETEICQS